MAIYSSSIQGFSVPIYLTNYPAQHTNLMLIPRDQQTRISNRLGETLPPGQENN